MSTYATAIRVARRELRGGLKGFRIFLACLALGVGAIAAVGSIASAITAGLEADARKILGGDASVSRLYRDLTAEERRWLEDSGKVSRSVVMRSIARVPAHDRRSLIDFKAVDDAYPLYGAVVFKPAQPIAEILALRDGMWGAAVEQSLLGRLGIQRGDMVRVGTADFQVRAIIVREPDRAGGGGFSLGPRFLAAAESLPATGLIQPGSLARYVYRIRLPADTILDDWKQGLTEAFPDAGWRLRDRRVASPTVQRSVDRTTLFMTLVGLTALLVGGVGVSNAVRTFLAGKVDTIATLKCIGASSRLIFQVYLTQVAVMAAGGIAAGLLIGAAIPSLAKGVLADNLPVDPQIGLYWGPLALAAGFGVLTALVFSLWPIATACATPAGSLFRHLVAPVRRWPTIRIALATVVAAGALVALAIATAHDRWVALWFVAGAIAALFIFRIAGWLVGAVARRWQRTRRTTLRLALANLYRPGAPTTTVVMSLGLGLTVFVAVALIEGNLRHQLDQAMPARAPGFFFIDIQPHQVAGFERAVRGVDSVAEIRRTPMLRGRIAKIAGVPVDRATIATDARWMIRGSRGVTWAASPPDGTRLIAGKWWPPDYAGPPLVSLAAGAANGFGLSVGETLTVNILGRPITATIANIRDVQWRSLRINFVLIFAPGVLDRAPHTQLATVRTDPAAEPAIEKAVTDRFANITPIRVRDVLRTIGETLGRIGTAIRLSAVVTIIAGVLVLAGAIAAGHHRRVYDAVVLKVLGATRRDVAAVFVIEYGLLALATAAIAAAVGTLAGWAVVVEVMRLEWVFLPGVVAGAVLISAVVTLAFGFVGTWRALGQKAAPLLRND